MNIGIDLDGVVYDSEEMLKCCAEFHDLKLGGNGVVNAEEMYCQKRYNWTLEQEQEFLKEHLVDILKKAPLKYMAKESLILLKKAGHKLIAITSRGNVFEEEAVVTKKRLKKDKLPFDEVVLYAKDKAKVCKEKNIDVMIDDMYPNVINVANNGIKCLYFRDIILKFIEHENVVEVNNWGEVIRQINLMTNKKISL